MKTEDQLSEFQSLRGELAHIFGVPKVREGESWTCAMLRKITEELIHEEERGYSRGVTAGKKEALGYNQDEKLNYIRFVSYNEGYMDAKKIYKK